MLKNNLRRQVLQQRLSKAVADKLLEAFTAPGTDERQLHQQSVKWLMDLKTDLHPYPI